MSKREGSKYYTNKKVKAKIDSLLQQNARNVANYCTGSKYDLVTEEAFDKAWLDIITKVKGLDEQMYKVIVKQDD